MNEWMVEWNESYLELIELYNVLGGSGGLYWPHTQAQSGATGYEESYAYNFSTV